MAKRKDTVQLTEKLNGHLIKLYGPLLGSRELWKVFGYASPAAYRQARARNLLPVREFEIEGRRGHFALTYEVARWLAMQSSQDSSELPAEDPEAGMDTD